MSGMTESDGLSIPTVGNNHSILSSPQVVSGDLSGKCQDGVFVNHSTLLEKKMAQLVKFNSFFPFSLERGYRVPVLFSGHVRQIFPSVDYDPADVWKETFPNESLS
jgi:hypothetical protein